MLFLLLRSHLGIILSLRTVSLKLLFGPSNRFIYTNCFIHQYFSATARIDLDNIGAHDFIFVLFRHYLIIIVQQVILNSAGSTCLLVLTKRGCNRGRGRIEIQIMIRGDFEASVRIGVNTNGNRIVTETGGETDCCLYLSFEAKNETSGSASPIAGRRGLTSSELKTEDELALDLDPDLVLDLLTSSSSSHPNMSL
nr:hypothetical protein Iba_chr06dCG10550 [Ipomoea batatas]